MQVEFSGRWVVVAGGSRGIGRSIALAFAEAGAAVSICARGAPALETTSAEIAAFGNTVHAARCDLSQLAEIERYIAEAGAALGGIDILINNATGGGQGDSKAGWDASLSVDLLGAVRASRAALPLLERGVSPAIINIASGSGLNPRCARRPWCGQGGSDPLHPHPSGGSGEDGDLGKLRGARLH
jgi:3-oxoacyl-[acyl-carrier protein] reductase